MSSMYSAWVIRRHEEDGTAKRASPVGSARFVAVLDYGSDRPVDPREVT